MIFVVIVVAELIGVKWINNFYNSVMLKTMSKCNEIKDKEQRKALNAWAFADYCGSVVAGTGFGKSRIGVMAIGYILRKDSKAKGIVLVPTVQLQDQFEGEFQRW